MRLNPDCVRDVLLTVESMSDGRIQYLITSDEELQSFIDGSPALQAYECEEVDYHFIQCINAGYLTGAKKAPGGFTFVDLSPSGHEFLNNVRSNTVWTKTKEKIKPMGTVSLNVISQVAAAFVKSGLGL